MLCMCLGVFMLVCICVSLCMHMHICICMFICILAVFFSNYLSLYVVILFEVAMCMPVENSCNLTRVATQSSKFYLACVPGSHWHICHPTILFNLYSIIVTIADKNSISLDLSYYISLELSQCLQSQLYINHCIHLSCGKSVWVCWLK